MKGGQVIARILVVRTYGDDASDNTYSLSYGFTDELDKRGIIYEEEGGDGVTKENIENKIKKKGVKALFFFGHGGAFELLSGHNCEIMHVLKPIVNPFNIGKLSNSGLEFVFALACNSARGLGMLCAEDKKCIRSYIGFLGPIVFYYPDIERVGQAVNGGILAMVLGGASAGEAKHIIYRNLDQLYRDVDLELDIAKKSGDEQKKVDRLLSSTCTHDLRDFLCLLGEPGYKL